MVAESIEGTTWSCASRGKIQIPNFKIEGNPNIQGFAVAGN
jgi:hypothetical protein